VKERVNMGYTWAYHKKNLFQKSYR